MANTYLTRTPSSAGNRQKWTFSVWVKRSKIGVSQAIFTAGFNENNVDNIQFDNSDRINFFSYDGNTDYSLLTTRVFRDTSAWYHLQFVLDTTNSTANDRVQLYVNGVRETVLTTNTMPSQNYSGIFNNNGIAHYIGQYGWNSNAYFDGEMSHIHFSDGYALAPTVFGSTDSTTGEWQINTSPSFTLGTNGFTILKDGNTITDQSSNSNNFSLAGGTLTKTEDCPSNVFATLNPLIKARTGDTATYGSGNTTYKSTSTSWGSGLSTIMPSSGKWYFEVKPTDNANTIIGLIDVDKNPEFLNGTSTYGYLGYKGLGYFSRPSGNTVVYKDNATAYSSLTEWSSGNICGVAIDLDNQEMFLHINGTYTNSGNPATRANPYDFSSVFSSGDNVAFGVSSQNNYITYVNFGNGYFQTTAVSSAGTNASGIGIFEYDVPSGYTALSTKGLNL